MTDIAGVDVIIESRKAESGSKKVVKSLNNIDRANDKVQKETKETADAFEKSSARIASSTGKVDKRFKKTAKNAKAANKEIKGLGGGAKALSASMSGLAKVGLAAVAAGFLAAGLAIKGSIKTFATFQQAIADLSAITGAVGDDLKFFEKAAREMGAATTLSASEVADAFRLVASAKPDLLESKEALKAVTASAITLAEAAGISVPEAANTMASALNQFGQEADQAVRFTNVLAAGSKFGAASIAEMGEAMKFAGVAASNFGLTFEETNAALQLLSTNAIKGGEAGTQLKGVLLNLETKMEGKFRPSVVGFATAMENLGKANLTAGEKTKLFGTRNFIAGEIIAGNTDKLIKLTEQVSNTSIATEQAATRTDTYEGASKRLGSAFEELQHVLTGDSGIGVALQGFIDSMASGILVMANFFAGVETGTQIIKRFKEENQSLQEAFNTLPIEQVKASIEGLEAIVASNNTRMAELREELANGGNAAGEAAKELLNLTNQNASAHRSLTELNKSLEVEREVIVELTEAEKKALKVEKEIAKFKEAQAKKAKAVLKRLDDKIDALKRTNLEQEIHVALLEAGAEAESIEGVAITEKITLLDEVAEARRKNIEEINAMIAAEDKLAAETKKAAEDAAEVATKAAEETQEAWQKSRDSLSDFFTLLIHDGENAWDTLLGGFKNMLIKMATEAAANQILIAVDLIGGGVTGAATSLVSGASGGGGATSLLSNAASIYSGFSGGGLVGGITSGIGMLPTAWQGAASSYVGSIAQTGSNVLGSAGITAGANTNLIAGGAVNAGAGFAGNAVGNLVFGESEYGNIMGTVGSVIGSFWGPWFSALGGFIGNGLGSLFGGTQRADKEGNEIDLATGEIEAFNRHHNKEFRTAVDELSSMLVGFSDAIGGSTAKLKVTVHGEDGLKLDTGSGDVKYSSAGDLISAGMKEIVEQSETLSDSLKTLVRSFEGSAKQVGKFVVSMVAVEKLASTNPVAELTGEIAKAQEMAGRTFWQSFQIQTKQLDRIVENFNGAAFAAERMSSALAINKNAMAELVISIHQISEAMNTSFETTIQGFRDASKTPDELQFSRLDELKKLERQIPNTKDPVLLAERMSKFEELSKTIFQNLTPDQQFASGDLYADKLEGILAIGQTRLDDTLGLLQTQETELNDKLNTLLNDTAARNEESANTNLQASENNLQASENNLEASENFNGFIPTSNRGSQYYSEVA